MNSLQEAVFEEDLITIKRFKLDGHYTDERLKKHQEVILIKVKDKEGSTEKEAILLAGGSGAGKSTIVKEFFLPEVEDDGFGDFVYIDSDDIKKHLDEYKEYCSNEDTVYYAAFYVHAESTDIVDKLLEYCLDNSLSFIYDGTMSWKPAYDKLLTDLRNNDYHVIGVYVDITVEEAKRRNIVRFEETKRYVPEEIVIKANINSAITFAQLENCFDEVLMFNNTAPYIKGMIFEPFYNREWISTEPFEGNIYKETHFDCFIEKSKLSYVE